MNRPSAACCCHNRGGVCVVSGPIHAVAGRIHLALVLDAGCFTRGGAIKLGIDEPLNHVDRRGGPSGGRSGGGGCGCGCAVVITLSRTPSRHLHRCHSLAAAKLHRSTAPSCARTAWRPWLPATAGEPVSSTPSGEAAAWSLHAGVATIPQPVHSPTPPDK